MYPPVDSWNPPAVPVKWEAPAVPGRLPPPAPPQIHVPGPAAVKVPAAAANQGPRLLVVSASWCKPCQTLIREVLPTINVQGFRTEIVDGDQHPEIVAKYNVKTYPTLLIDNGENGYVMWRHNGSPSRDSLTAAMLNSLRFFPNAAAAPVRTTPAPAAPVIHVRRVADDLHTHTCSRCGTTWNHDINPTHNCANCGREQSIQDRQPRPVTPPRQPATRYQLPSPPGG